MSKVFPWCIQKENRPMRHCDNSLPSGLVRSSTETCDWFLTADIRTHCAPN
jgi:hypothetical protein